MPDKSLGQHWLHDEASLNGICRLAELQPGDTVLEVGPGLGTLTVKLVQQAGRVVAVELDQKLASELPSRITAPNLEVKQASILDYNLTGLPKDYKVVANIPYYLTAKLLRQLTESPNPPLLSVLLVQKEVAERIAAAPGQMSLLAVSVQYYCEVELGQEVSAKLFTPQPKVDSQVIKLTRREKVLFPDLDTKDFFRVVKAGFSQRRKKLRSTLSAGLQIDKHRADELLAQANLSPSARAQELSLDDWAKLTSLLY